ncbi:hypothetical protein ACFXHD_12945 [Streptomyces hydrogenans]|uniref:hypothetical protein n=1 Tax=Streptomyces hydrogenans TaxID=1873719 RepID=UPI0019B48F54|nr:hypothetical protein GCM10018784_69650 [Streptomyces hydrogenans]
MPTTAHTAITRQGLRVEKPVRARITEDLQNEYEEKRASGTVDVRGSAPHRAIPAPLQHISALRPAPRSEGREAPWEQGPAPPAG